MRDVLIWVAIGVVLIGFPIVFYDLIDRVTPRR